MDSGHDTDNGGDLQGSLPGVGSQGAVFSGSLDEQQPQNVLASPMQQPGMDGPQSVMPTQQPVVPSGVGDVLLPVTEKKKRRWPVVVALVAIVIAVGIGALIWYLQSRAVTPESMRIAFNRYANYLLYGEESDKDLEEEYDLHAEYYISNSFYKNNGEYFARLRKYVDDYIDKYNSINVNSDELFDANNGIIFTANFVIVYGKTGELDSEDLIYLVKENDNIDDVYNYIKDYYGAYIEEPNSVLQDFYDLMIASNVVETEVLYAYKDADCLMNVEDNKDCEVRAKYKEKIIEYSRDKYYADVYVKNNIYGIVDYTWRANEALNALENL